MRYPLTDAQTARKALPIRKRDSHKGCYGKAAIVAGSEQYSGAAYLATAACLRSGVGYTTLFTPQSVWEKVFWKAPEALLERLNDGGSIAFNEEDFCKLLSYDAVAYGMGLGATEETARGAKYLLERYEGKLILDADALNALAAFCPSLDGLFADKKCGVILTPHIKEFSRLSGQTVEEIIKDSVGCAESLAKRLDVVVLLKNAVSVVTDGTQTYLNDTGNSGQAKGGSGDVLSGLLAGICGSGATLFGGACAAAYLSGKAANIAAKSMGEYALTASDIIAHLGKAFLSLTEDTDKKSGKA